MGLTAFDHDEFLLCSQRQISHPCRKKEDLIPLWRLPLGHLLLQFEEGFFENLENMEHSKH